MMTSKVDHPDHYGGGDNPLEVIKVLKYYLTRDEFIGFLNGNIIKYTLRWRSKGNEEDLWKQNWYSNYLIEFLKEEAENNDKRDN